MHQVSHSTPPDFNPSQTGIRRNVLINLANQNATLAQGLSFFIIQLIVFILPTENYKMVYTQL